jgi:uncharacterized protein (DUF362 family)
MQAFAEISFVDFATSIPAALDEIGAAEVLAGQKRILVKPNLVNASAPPITTPVECTAAIIEYCRAHSSAEIVIGEGCGEKCMDTPEIFERLGYVELAEAYGVELVDLNDAPTLTTVRPGCPVFPRMHLPEIVHESFVISAPVLKAHSLAVITGSLKNMVGVCPPEHYSGGGGSWKKAVFHTQMQQSIIDMCRHRLPDLSVMDATVGMAEYHLGGAHCDPPVQKILAGFDALAMDRRAAELLGRDWRAIGHLAEGVLDGDKIEPDGRDGYPEGQCDI